MRMLNISGLQAMLTEVGKWEREGNLFEAGAIIIIEVKEKGVYPTLSFLLFPSSGKKLFKFKSRINIERRELNA